MSKSLLKEKAEEHGAWQKNKAIFIRLHAAATVAHDQAHDFDCEDVESKFKYRFDYGEVNMILHKLSRILSKHSTKTNSDDWKDIAGYAILRHNEVSKDEQLDITKK